MRTGLLRFTLHAVGGTAFLACVLACGTPTGKMDQEEKKVDDKQSLSSEQPTNNSQSQPVGPTNGNFHATRELFKVGEVIRVQDGRVEPWLMADDKTQGRVSAPHRQGEDVRIDDDELPPQQLGGEGVEDPT